MQRIKGQETEVVLLVGGTPQDNLTCVRSHNLEWKTEILQEGYIGETTDRYDTIFKGVTGKLELHMDSPEAFSLIRTIVDKARRRTPGTQVNIKTTLNFPGGKRARIVVTDVEFGPLPVGFGSRADYGTFSVDYAGSEGNALPM